MMYLRYYSFIASRPSRGAWIEILLLYHKRREKEVAPLAGRVD